MAQDTFIVRTLVRTSGSYKAEIEFQEQRDCYDIRCNYTMWLDSLGFAILDDSCKFPKDGELYLRIQGKSLIARKKQKDLERAMYEFALKQESIFKNTKN